MSPVTVTGGGVSLTTFGKGFFITLRGIPILTGEVLKITQQDCARSPPQAKWFIL